MFDCQHGEPNPTSWAFCSTGVSPSTLVQQDNITADSVDNVVECETSQDEVPCTELETSIGLNTPTEAADIFVVTKGLNSSCEGYDQSSDGIDEGLNIAAQVVEVETNPENKEIGLAESEEAGDETDESVSDVILQFYSRKDRSVRKSTRDQGPSATKAT